MLYISEAHPTDGRQTQSNVREGILIEDPKTLAEREKVAREFASQFKVSLPILVDTIDNKVDKAYSAKPDRIYVIDAKGKIAYKGGPGPRGFRVSDVPKTLDALLGVKLASKAGVSDRPGGTGNQPSGFGRPGQIVPPFVQARLRLTDEQKKQVEDLQKEAARDLERILTPEQRARYKRMMERLNRR